MCREYRKSPRSVTLRESPRPAKEKAWARELCDKKLPHNIVQGCKMACCQVGARRLRSPRHTQPAASAAASKLPTSRALEISTARGTPCVPRCAKQCSQACFNSQSTLRLLHVAAATHAHRCRRVGRRLLQLQPQLCRHDGHLAPSLGDHRKVTLLVWHLFICVCVLCATHTHHMDKRLTWTKPSLPGGSDFAHQWKRTSSFNHRQQQPAAASTWAGST